MCVCVSVPVILRLWGLKSVHVVTVCFKVELKLGLAKVRVAHVVVMVQVKLQEINKSHCIYIKSMVQT